MSPSSNGAEPFVSFRHARIGRIGEAGQMPTGWRAEHLDDVEILDVGSRGRPWITLRVGFGAGIGGPFVGLGVAPYLSASKSRRVAVVAEVTLGEWENIGEAMLVLRELKEGGDLVGQTLQAIQIVQTPQAASVIHTMAADSAVAEPVLMIRRETEAAGALTMTFSGLAFGKVADDPHWRFAAVGD